MKIKSTLMLFVVCSQLHAQQVYKTDSLINDFRYFIEKLEETHPDPYSKYGGRPMFRRSAEVTERWMRYDSISTKEQLASYINTFLVPLHDGHTLVANPNSEPSNNKEMLCAPIKFKVLDDRLFVRAIDNRMNELVGSRLLEVEGVEIDDLVIRMASKYPAENNAGMYLNASWNLRNKQTLEYCIGKELSDSLHITLLDTQKNKVHLAFPFLTQDVLRAMKYENYESQLDLPTKNISYSFIGNDTKTMYFRTSTMNSKDNIEFEYKNGMSTFADDLSHCYFVNNAMQPDNVEEAIAKLPSFSEEFRKMLIEMQKHKCQNLIIDLRGNGGGWFPIAAPTLYQMWGNDYLGKNMGTAQCILISPLYIEKLNTTLEDFNVSNGSNFRFGDYAFIESQDVTINDEVAESIIMSNRMMSSSKDVLLKQKGIPVYTPKNVFVVTDAQTFSAAFHYAFYLWKMGAKVVGTSSSQAPNTYMAQTPLHLPITNLFASISNTVQMFLPSDDPKAEMLIPDYAMTEDLYHKYGYDSNAEIIYILNELVEK